MGTEKVSKLLQRTGLAPRRLLVTGVERSGTTWVAEALGHAPEAVYVHEPDNPWATPGGAHIRSSLGLYPVLQPGDEREGCDSYRRDWAVAFAGGFPAIPGAKRFTRTPLELLPDRVRNALVGAASSVLWHTRQRPNIVVTKTVHATFALEWLVDLYRPDVIVTRRDPFAIVGSVLQVMPPDYDKRLYSLYDDPLIQERFVEPLGLPLPPKGLGHVSGCAWWVGFHCAALADVTSRHSDWVVVDHDQFAKQSGPSFLTLFRRLGLPWSDAVDRYLESSNQPGTGFETKRTTTQANERWRTTLGDDATEVQRIFDLFPTCQADRR
jgi:hypothetical protein